jgi:pseudaminic acid synthase
MIADRLIGLDYPPFIIAELSGNHNQSLDRALLLVEQAAQSGAHALKLQTYLPDTITLNVNSDAFRINDNDSLWHGKSLYQLYNEAHTPWEWHEPIFKYANELGLICFSSPFDESAVDFLETLNVPAYKIASFENNHLPLIKKASLTGKPLIISTGMATLGEIENAVVAAQSAGCKQLVLLNCTSTYPASPVNSNIRKIPHLRDMFKCEVGLSDHTLGIGVAVASVSLGASVIEKHFTLSRDDGGVDCAFSLEPPELSALVLETARAWESLGTVKYGPSSVEVESLKFKRSIYVSTDIKAGERFSESNIRVVRPGHGAPPYMYPMLIGKTARKNYLKGSPLSIESLLE